MNVGYSDIALNERYYLAKQPYAVCNKIIKPNYPYRVKQIPESNDKIDMITGINLISLTTHEIKTLDIRHLLKFARDKNGNIHLPSGNLNSYLISLINNAVPYITLREVLQATVDYIANRHIYFTEEIVEGVYDINLRRHRTNRILNCQFAEYVCHNNH